MLTSRFPAFFFLLGLGFVTLLIQPRPAISYRLPDTGQTQCYDDVGNPISCPSTGQRFYGQDGNYKGPQPVYKDNNDGTVTDLNTRLTWQQSDNDNDVARTWQQAVDYCADRDLGGKTDWRLPSRLELLSIVDYSRTNPAINRTYFPDCRSNDYWSGTVVASDPANGVWGVAFDYGYTYWTGKEEPFTGYVRCVRGGP